MDLEAQLCYIKKQRLRETSPSIEAAERLQERQQHPKNLGKLPRAPLKERDPNVQPVSKKVLDRDTRHEIRVLKKHFSRFSSREKYTFGPSVEEAIFAEKLDLGVGARTLAALIAVQYFRFETWLQQSGLLAVDPATRGFVLSEGALRRVILLAADMQGLKMDYERVERHIYTILGQAHQCLRELQKLREKYALHDGDDDRGIDASIPGKVWVNNEIPAAEPLFQNRQIAKALSKDASMRQSRTKAVSFYRRVNFTWSFKDDTNDRDIVMSHIQTLKDCNDALRECLPPLQQQAADRLVSLKTLTLSSSASDLKGIGNAASSVHDSFHDQIYQAVMLKARRVDASSQRVSSKELEEVEIDSSKFSVGGQEADYYPQSSNTRVLAKYVDSIQWVSFNAALTEDDLDLLKERIAILCTLLRSAGHPYFSALPLCKGFFEKTRTCFALAYQLPPFAASDQPPCSLYSILPRNKHSVTGEKVSASNSVLPTLEQRYDLAAALAEGVLSLLSVDWMHKTINSRNVALYNARPASSSPVSAPFTGTGLTSRLDFCSPQLLGFGLARRERQGERTVDLRDGGQSPWRYWLHPKLGADGPHRRFERPFDVYALGVVLFEIGMWQDAHYYSSGEAGIGVDEFRRRLVHVCAREMAHRMGEAYKAAVMACLDGDEVWSSAPGVGDGKKTEDNAGELSMTELFYVHVYSVLRGCCKVV
ncbi:hypothetical protein DL767_007314 [Monosporascus sp. MG133]|nr:hypothetical protein DL767_007314 [Monosporascus sp. MG133]